MRQYFVAFLLLNIAASRLASAKTVALNDFIENSNGMVDSNEQIDALQSGEDSDVINFCRMCKSYVSLYQQADDTVVVRLPLEDLCTDVEENDQNLCLESIDNLHRLPTFDLSNVDNLEVCQLVSLCEEMSSSEEEEAANGSDSIEETGSEQNMESNEIVENLLNNFQQNHSHTSPVTHPVGHATHPTHAAPGPHHGVTPTPGAHPPLHPHKLDHNNGHGHNGHSNGHHHGKHHHSGASSNAVISSLLLLFISILISENVGSA